MTKGTTMVKNNVFKPIRLFGKGSSSMGLFSLQLMTLRSYITDHSTMVASKNKLRSTQFLKMGPIRLNLINHLVGFIPCQSCLYFSN